ncbi:hypothetical protein WICPIJ_003576 [Wickerhamomyces pijperi]|uniref:Uncharacterized protein n=1 Tax=Wickerhamomyces pijperi TaxID=599730 RepID=A0A9P8TP41_WICPI|nr:hypothetical protein WICPIJ_003576 [Wickerhamomyces pijperi]
MVVGISLRKFCPVSSSMDLKELRSSMLLTWFFTLAASWAGDSSTDSAVKASEKTDGCLCKKLKSREPTLESYDGVGVCVGLVVSITGRLTAPPTMFEVLEPEEELAIVTLDSELFVSKP